MSSLQGSPWRVVTSWQRTTWANLGAWRGFRSKTGRRSHRPPRIRFREYTGTHGIWPEACAAGRKSCRWVKAGAFGQHFLRAPTILAWDLGAFCRILPLEARSPDTGRRSNGIGANARPGGQDFDRECSPRWFATLPIPREPAARRRFLLE